MDLENITLLDLIDKHTLQTLQDAFANATGMAALATDDTGSVTDLSNPTDFCMRYTRKSAKGCERCNKCDLQGGSESVRSGKPAVYFCHAGLVDFAAPIILNGKHIGSLIGGQVLTQKPDEEKFKKIAKDIGVDPNLYIEALRKIKIVPKSQVDAAAKLLYQMANALSDIGYQRIQAVDKSEKNEELLKELNSGFSDIENEMKNVIDSIRRLEDGIEEIKKSASSSAKAVDNTDGIVRSIENTSTQLTLIGFNASIEAKRAGAAGAGFNVIAQEVRNLAGKNSKQASDVDTTLSAIKKSISDAYNEFEAVDIEIEKNAKIIETLKNKMDEIVKLVQSFK